MAIWQGIYSDSIGISRPTNLLVYQQSADTGRSRISTTYSEDLSILPDIYINSLKQINSKTRNMVCPTDIRSRFARFYLDSSQWFIVPIPFFPVSNNWNIFWQQAKANPLIIEFDYQGETISQKNINL